MRGEKGARSRRAAINRSRSPQPCRRCRLLRVERGRARMRWQEMGPAWGPVAGGGQHGGQAQPTATCGGYASNKEVHA
eukprot:347589-Chlamydomonas_euryale.AAC.1